MKISMLFKELGGNELQGYLEAMSFGGKGMPKKMNENMN